MVICLDSGFCRCVLEPRGASGLEGFQAGDEFAFRKVCPERDKKHPYFRLFPVFDSDYYETCSSRAFNKYFQKKDD